MTKGKITLRKLGHHHSSMNTPSATIYDHILYPGHSYRQTHPDRLAALSIPCWGYFR